ncbi:hypothetical protein [Geothrix sp. 21YS21S-4]|uniref:hypothetical protein n=1 Tax=Geothrix sp. 21YS21S-4 TaxID=3068889 RepID=UPI0027B90C0D|nr:hypothetical protein [Geothrix sp. 21YS21S-4]
MKKPRGPYEGPRTRFARLSLLAPVFLCAPHLFADEPQGPAKKLILGGYGELVYQHFDYSADVNRYNYPEKFGKENRGITDIPHFVLFASYDFGNSWKFSTEVEFEHGGSGSALEMENEEAGEFEHEIERGGEVVLEQFWLEKTFSDRAHVRFGHLVVPVGRTNSNHLPNQYFTVLRPEGENRILPLTWHENGIEFWGKTKHFKYQILLVNGLRAEGFGSSQWIKGGSGSPYEYNIASSWAAAFRVEHRPLDGLSLALSGYAGQSAANSLKYDRYKGLDGNVTIGAFDAQYNKHGLIVRVNSVFGSLGDSKEISAINKSLPGLSASPRDNVASGATTYGIEAGYDVFYGRGPSQLYPFVRYEYYNSMQKTEPGILADSRYSRKVATAGFNYFATDKIVLKGEYSKRIFKEPYKSENTISLGVMFAGMF